MLPSGSVRDSSVWLVNRLALDSYKSDTSHSECRKFLKEPEHEPPTGTSAAKTAVKRCFCLFFLLTVLQVFPRLSDPSGHVMTVHSQSDLIRMELSTDCSVSLGRRRDQVSAAVQVNALTVWSWSNRKLGPVQRRTGGEEPAERRADSS